MPDNSKQNFAEFADIGIVGGGMVGAACALACQVAGFAVHLIEAKPPTSWNPEQSPNVRISFLSPQNIAWLEALGVWQTLQTRRAQPCAAMWIWADQPERALKLNAAELDAEYLGYLVENNVLQQVLFEKININNQNNALKKIHIFDQLPEKFIHSFNHDLNHNPQVRLADQTSLGAKLWVGADGAQSWLRQTVQIPIEQRGYGQLGMVARVRFGKAHQNTAYQRFLPNGEVLALLPIGNDEISLVWSLPEARARALLANNAQQFCAELTAAAQGILGTALSCVDRAAFPLAWQNAQSYVHNHVALMGDAAHVIHPLAGQGVNLGLADARELVKLSGRFGLSGEGLKANLSQYHRTRQAETAQWFAVTDGLQRLFGAQDVRLGFLRGWGLAKVGEMAFLRRWLIAQAIGEN